MSHYSDDSYYWIFDNFNLRNIPQVKITAKERANPIEVTKKEIELAATKIREYATAINSNLKTKPLPNISIWITSAESSAAALAAAAAKKATEEAERETTLDNLNIILAKLTKIITVNEKVDRIIEISSQLRTHETESKKYAAYKEYKEYTEYTALIKTAMDNLSGIEINIDIPELDANITKLDTLKAELDANIKQLDTLKAELDRLKAAADAAAAKAAEAKAAADAKAEAEVIRAAAEAKAAADAAAAVETKRAAAKAKADAEAAIEAKKQAAIVAAAAAAAEAAAAEAAREADRVAAARAAARAAAIAAEARSKIRANIERLIPQLNPTDAGTVTTILEGEHGTLDTDTKLIQIFRKLFETNKDALEKTAEKNGIDPKEIDTHTNPITINKEPTVTDIILLIDKVTRLRPILLNNVETRLVVNSYIETTPSSSKLFLHTQMHKSVRETEEEERETKKKPYFYLKNSTGTTLKTLILDPVLPHKTNQGYSMRRMFIKTVMNTSKITIESTAASAAAAKAAEAAPLNTDKSVSVNTFTSSGWDPFLDIPDKDKDKDKYKCRESPGKMGITYDYVAPFSYMVGQTLHEVSVNTKAAAAAEADKKAAEAAVAAAAKKAADKTIDTVDLAATLAAAEAAAAAATDDAVSKDTVVNLLDTINASVKEKNDVILFVFGITGSGKDTFLNSVYGKLLDNEHIHDDDANKTDNHINTVLNDLPPSNADLNEKWYYTDQLNRFVQTFKEFPDNKDPTIPRKDIEEQIKENMRQKTPFNTQSTRGFNIKHFTNIEHKKNGLEVYDGNITVINVPGFEPLASILILSLYIEPTFTRYYNRVRKQPISQGKGAIAMIDKTAIVGMLYKFILDKLFEGTMKIDITALNKLFDPLTILEKERPTIINNTTLTPGEKKLEKFEHTALIPNYPTYPAAIGEDLDVTTELASGWRKTVAKETVVLVNGSDRTDKEKEKEEDVRMLLVYEINKLLIVLYQSLYILNTLNIMAAILVNFKTIQTWIKVEKPTNPAEDIFTYVKDTYMKIYDISIINTDTDFEFIDDKRLACLKPFYKMNTGKGEKYLLINNNTKNNEKNNKTNSISIETYYLETNLFIIALITKLFLNTLDTPIPNPQVRYNVNVIRPLRQDRIGDQITQYNKFLAAEPTRSATATTIRAAVSLKKQIYLQPFGTNGKEKIIKNIVLDATLIETLSGFCEISQADTKANAN
jgi:hypothetical protein